MQHVFRAQTWIWPMVFSMPKDKEHLDANMLHVVFKLVPHEPERPRWCTCWPSVDRREQRWGRHETICDQHAVIWLERMSSSTEVAASQRRRMPSMWRAPIRAIHPPDGREGAWPIPYPLVSWVQGRTDCWHSRCFMSDQRAMDRNSDFEAEVDVLLAWLRKGFEKRERGEFAQWSQGSLMIGGRFPAAWNMTIHTVNVNVGWCKPWMKRQITFRWLQVIGWACMSTWISHGDWQRYSHRPGWHGATGVETGEWSWLTLNRGLWDGTTNLLSTAIRWYRCFDGAERNAKMRMQSQKHVSGIHLKAVRIVNNPMSVAQATCSRMKREKVVALHALDLQTVSYSKHKEHTNSSIHNLQAPRFTFSILIQKSGLPKKVARSKIFIVWWGSILWHQLGKSLEGFVSWFHRGAFGNTLVVESWFMQQKGACHVAGIFGAEEDQDQAPQDFGPPFP